MVVLAVLVVLAACGGDEPALEPQAADSLRARVAAVRAAARAGDSDEARSALAGFSRELDALEDAGAVRSDRAMELHAAAADVEEALATVPATTTTTAPPPDEDDDEDEDEDEGDRKKGKGRDRDDD
jgi:hypothetical protein